MSSCWLHPQLLGSHASQRGHLFPQRQQKREITETVIPRRQGSPGSVCPPHSPCESNPDQIHMVVPEEGSLTNSLYSRQIWKEKDSGFFFQIFMKRKAVTFFPWTKCFLDLLNLRHSVEQTFLRLRETEISESHQVYFYCSEFLDPTGSSLLNMLQMVRILFNVYAEHSFDL